jgi:uncharacterized membrane protein
MNCSVLDGQVLLIGGLLPTIAITAFIEIFFAYFLQWMKTGQM